MPIYFAGTMMTWDTFHGSWDHVRPLLNPSLEVRAQFRLAIMMQGAVDFRVRTWEELADAVKLELGKRENYFFEQDSEHRNIAKVIFETVVPTSSIGWDQPTFFQQLGHPRNRRWPDDVIASSKLAAYMALPFIRALPLTMASLTEGLKRRAEQEYLLQNMVKGALWEAAEVADACNLGIAVRGTGLLAHMGIESGDPTKAQEFKNKTSKLVDLFLCDEMESSQLGAVVHYDPRTAWSSQTAALMADNGTCPMFHGPASDADWQIKKMGLHRRVAQLGARFERPSDDALRSAFMSRSKEYMEEDHLYRKGHYAKYTTLVGPYIRLKLRADKNMVGDHDLFAFTKPEADEYGVFLPESDPRVARAQKALQGKPTFQAQHGGIWYWRPTAEFNVGIKTTIMRAHGPLGKEPLVYIRPGKQVTAAYYVDTDNLASVWSNPAWTLWMADTHSGPLVVPTVPPSAPRVPGGAAAAAAAGGGAPARPGAPPLPGATGGEDGW